MLQVMKRKDADLDQRLPSREAGPRPADAASTTSDRAIDAAKKAGDKGPLAVGITVTLGQVMDVLKRFGVTPIEALGQPFDPMKHQAIQVQPAADGEDPNTVKAVVQPGFMLHDRVLRPAAVIVAQ